MTLKEQVQINRKIMELIKSKYPGDFPEAYSTPKSRYYQSLGRDIVTAEAYESVESSRV